MATPTTSGDSSRVYRVNRACLEEESVRLAPDADRFTRELGALAKAYLGALDKQGEVQSLIEHLDPRGFHIALPTGTLTSEDELRSWYRESIATFANPRHTVVALEPCLLGNDSARANLSIHFEADRRDPDTPAGPRANMTVDRIWELSRRGGGRWVISGQRDQEQPTPEFSKERAREFAVSYLDNLDRRDLQGLLGVLAPQGELNIALNSGEIIEDFPQWLEEIAATFTTSKHRVLGLVPLENADGTIDAHLKIHFTAERIHPGKGEDTAVDFTVERIWTIRPDASGKPRLVSQRPFSLLDLAERVATLDLDGAIDATRCGESEVVRDWLRSGGDPNARGADGFNLFLAAASHGNVEVLRMLLLERVGPHRANPELELEDPRRPGYRTGILAVHLATQKGDIPSTLLVLSKNPEHLHARIEVNGHTPLLQVAFYGHVALAEAMLGRLASILPQGSDVPSQMRRLFTATTVRGINAIQLARQFRNKALIDVLAPRDKSSDDERQADTRALLEAIAGGPRNPDAGTPAQQASEEVFQAITSGLSEAGGLTEPECSGAVERIIASIKARCAHPDFDPNRLAGQLLQTPIIAAVTGNNASGGVARLRREIADILLEKGADPDKEERYPMAVDAVIRAAVFNHLSILRRFEEVMGPEAMKTALNHKPAVNGLTALHDSVLRAATGATGYLDQIRWARKLGAAVDIADHTGRTQRDFAAAAFVTPGQKENAAAVWEALQLGVEPPKPYEVFGYDNLTFLTIPRVVMDKGAVWRTLTGRPDAIVKNLDLDGPNAMSAECAQNHSFGTMTINRCWPDGRAVLAKEVQAFAAQTRGTPILPIMRFPKSDPCIKELLGAGLFGALIVDPESSEAVRALLRDVYFPQRPSANVTPRPSTAVHPLGKRAVGADNIAQRAFQEYAKMMDTLNEMFIGGITFSQPAAAEVLADLPTLKQIGVRLIEIDRTGIQAALATSLTGERLQGAVEAAVSAIEAAAREAGLVLSGRFCTGQDILDAFGRGYRHITTITERAAHEIAWRGWVPGGKIEGRQPLPREMPIRPPAKDFNDMRRALLNGELVVFGAQTTPDLNNATQLANSGILNSVAIEREHGTWSTEDTLAHIAVLKERTNVMVRLGSALDPEVGTFIAAGVAGLIATAVLNAAEAKHFLAAVMEANIETYGANDRRKWAVPVVMMETEGAANDTEQIVAMLKEHQGVCHVGPLDLSASLGAAWGTERYESTLRKIQDTSKAAGVPLVDVLNTLKEALDHGLGMVLAPVGMDAGALNTGIAGTNPLASLQGDNTA